MRRICSECGCPVEDGDVFCPDCGHKLESQAQGQKQQQQQSQQQTKHEKKSVAARAKATDSESATESAEPYRTFSELFWDCEFYKIFKGKKFDLGQRVFEFGAFCWETINVAWQTTTRRLFLATGRATRREFWSWVAYTLASWHWCCLSSALSAVGQIVLRDFIHSSRLNRHLLYHDVHCIDNHCHKAYARHKSLWLVDIVANHQIFYVLQTF